MLRAGLGAIENSSSKKGTLYSVTSVEGHPRRTNLDNVAEAIAEVEVDRFR